MLDILKRLKQIIVSVFIVTAVPAFASNNVIDVLVVYTKGVAEAYGGNPTTRINQLFQITNQIYLDSGVELEVRVAGTLMVDYTDDNAAETALNDITFNTSSAFNAVAAARAQANADMVIFYRPYKPVHGSCGLAWVGGVNSQGSFADPTLKDFMFAHIAFDGCGDFMTAHELGHNMGLRHSRKQDGEGGTFHFALGHGEDNKFTTIMAYQSAFNVDYWDGKVYKFSSPNLNCKGSPCGVDRNNTVSGADAVYTLNTTGPQIANFFNTQSTASPVSSAASSVSSGAASSIASSTAISSVQSSSSAANATGDKMSVTTPAVSTTTNAVSNNGGSSGGGGGAFNFIGLLMLGGLLVTRKRFPRAS